MGDQEASQSRKGGGAREAKVVTLCGSTRFETEFAQVNQRLTMEGHVVISLGMFSLPELEDYDWATDGSDLKGRLGAVHFQKIRMADEVYVVDPGGYVGESTRREIAYAESLGKPVRYLSRQAATGGQEMRTERLRLTRPVVTDAAGVFEVLGDPRTVEHNPSERLADLEAAAELVARWILHWEEHGFGYWSVRESGSDRIIGYVGVKRMLIHQRPVLNLVYRFVPQAWGRGFATEAATAVVSHALDERPTETIVARVRPDNHSSQNVALKVGLRRDASMDCQGDDGLDWAFTSEPANLAG